MDEPKPGATEPPSTTSLTADAALAQFTVQRAKERQIARLAARGIRAFVVGVGLCGLAGVAAIVVPPESFSLVVLPTAAIGGLAVAFGALLLFAALSHSRRYASGPS